MDRRGRDLRISLRGSFPDASASQRKKLKSLQRETLRPCRGHPELSRGIPLNLPLSLCSAIPSTFARDPERESLRLQYLDESFLRNIDSPNTLHPFRSEERRVGKVCKSW